jgi:tetratricopeptide (TPR) repeat protein
MQAPNAPPELDWQRRISANPRWAQAMLPVGILLATFLAYVDTLVLGFVFDDHVLIVTNDSIRSWRYFPSYFTSHIWSFRYPHLLANYYRPLFMTWLRLNDALFGLHPWGWHLTSVLAHVGVTYLVYRLAFELTTDRWIAGVAGLIFGLHPVHAEAVADITSIQEPLSTFFILAAILAFGRSRESGHRSRWLAASLVFTAAALLCKESGMVLPIVIAVFTWIHDGTDGREVAPAENRPGLLARLRTALGASFPFWLVVLIYVLLRIHALKGFAHVITPLTLSREFFTIPSVLTFYLRLLFWPVGLSCYYDTPYISSPNWHAFFLPALALATAIAALALWYKRIRHSAPDVAKAVAFACLWIGLTLLPVLNFRFLPEGELAHDRYVYLPSVGFVILVSVVLRQLAGVATRVVGQGAWQMPVFLLLAVVMGGVTARQNLFWADDLTLNYRAHEIAPRNVSATTSLAAAVAQRGMDGTAMALYQQALNIQPNFWRANVNLAYLYYAHGNYAEASRYFARACAADLTDGDQFLYLGMALLRLGKLSEAEQAVRSALLVRPEGKNYHLGLGMVLRGEGRLPEAKSEIEVTLAEDPQNAQAKALLAEVNAIIQAQAENTPAGKSSKANLTSIK